jgi:hypothetical protein
MSNQTIESRKHLLILGAGASMSLVPRKIEKRNSKDGTYTEDYDANENNRLPSGSELVKYIADYKRNLLFMFIVKDNTLTTPKCNYYNNLKKIIKINPDLSLQDNLSKYQNLQREQKYVNEHNIIKLYYVKYDQNFDVQDKIYYGKCSITEAYIFFNMHSSMELFWLYVASYLTSKYLPISIDYFANNLDFYAAREINELININNLGLEKEKIITMIHKYLKAIICELLFERQKNTINIALNNTEHNYIRQIIWSLSLEANRYNQDVKQYIENNLDVITFNYDNTTDILLQKYQELAINPISGGDLKDVALDPKKINILHVYSHLSCSGDDTYDSKEFNIARAFLEEKPDNFKAMLDHANRYIFWIRNQKEMDGKQESKNNTKSLSQKLINEAQNIYFLGFGFDENNLINIGFESTAFFNEGNNNGSLPKKRVFVSKTTGKINEILMKIINGCSTKSDNKLNSRMGDANVFVSDRYNNNSSTLTTFNYINEAFEQDFDI